MSKDFTARVVSAVLVGWLWAESTACGGKSSAPTAPSNPAPTTTSISVSVSSPIVMGRTAQASGVATLSDGQTQPVTSGWRSDVPTVATVTDNGLVSAVANGLANIYVVSGGRQGQQGIRVVPDYQGTWSGELRVRSCSQSGIWYQCNNWPAGTLLYYFSLSLAQSGDQMTAGLRIGPSYPTAPAPIAPDGTASFTTTYVSPTSDARTDDDTVTVDSVRVGELTGTVTQVFRFPRLAGSGEQRITLDMAAVRRTSASPLGADQTQDSRALPAVGWTGMPTP